MLDVVQISREAGHERVVAPVVSNVDDWQGPERYGCQDGLDGRGWGAVRTPAQVTWNLLHQVDPLTLRSKNHVTPNTCLARMTQYLGDPGMVLGRVETEQDPEDKPEDAQGPGEVKGRLPAPVGSDEA